MRWFLFAIALIFLGSLLFPVSNSLAYVFMIVGTVLVFSGGLILIQKTLEKVTRRNPKA